MAGFLYVLDYALDTLQKRDLETYALITQIGSTGSGDNQFITSFYGPSNICTDGTFIYVADGDNNRIKKHLASDLSFVQKTVSAGYSTPSGICYSDGRVYFQDWGNYRIVVLDADDLTVELGTYFIGNQSGAVRDPGTFLEASGMTTNNTNIWTCDFTDFWSTAPNDWQSPIMKLTTGASPAFVSEYLPHASTEFPGGDDENQVTGISIGSDRIFISDFYSSRITMRDKDSFTFLGDISDDPLFRWDSPVQSVVASTDLYFSDRNSGNIVRVDLSTYTTQDVYTDANLSMPIGIAIILASPPAGPTITFGNITW